MRFLRLMLSLALGPPILVFGSVCALAALGAQAGRIDEDWDLLTHLAPVWLAGGVLSLLAGLAFIGRVRRPLIGAGLIAVLGGALLMAPEYLRDAGPTAPTSAPNQLKLIQINAWSGRNRDLAATAAWVAAQNPDVVTVNESSARFRDLLAASSGLHPACPDCVTMVFSRQRPVSTAIPQRPDNASGAPIDRATFRDARGEYTVIATHYTWPDRGGPYEGRVLAKVLEGFPKASLILAGDLNSTPWSFSRRREDRMFGMPRRTRALLSWPAGRFTRRRIPAPFPFLPIDQVYAGSDWATVSVERGPKLGSDHYPVVVILARRAPP